MYTPHYHITNSILDSLTQIEAIRSRVASSYIVPEREIELRYRATVEATHSSTSIEGNPLNIKQVEKILSDKTPLTRHQYAEIEVKNCKPIPGLKPGAFGLLHAWLTDSVYTDGYVIPSLDPLTLRNSHRPRDCRPKEIPPVQETPGV